MAFKPKVVVTAQPATIPKAVIGVQSKASSSDMRKKLQENSSINDEASVTISIPSPGAKDRNQTLLEKGVSVVRPEIIAATEFIPLVKDNDPSDATFTMSSGDQEFKIDITNAARLIEMQLVAQKMLMKNVILVLDSYASENLNSLLSYAELHLSSGYVEDIKLTNFETMKSKIKQVLESAQIEVEVNEDQESITRKDNSSNRNSRMTDTKLSKAAERKSKYLAVKFKTIDKKYANMIIEYLARKIIVVETNKFLAELANMKVATSRLFEILNTNTEALSENTNSSIESIVAYLRTVKSPSGAAAANGINYTKMLMSSYIEDVLRSTGLALSTEVTSRNILHVIKALSSDMQVKKRHTSSKSMSSDVIPQTVSNDEDPGLMNGVAAYQTFNVSSFFGNPKKSYNMVTYGNGGANFSKNAYQIVKWVVAASERHFSAMLSPGGSLNMNKIKQGVVPLLGRVLIDLTIHNNMSVKSSMLDYKSIMAVGANGSIAALNGGGLSVEDYCKIALYNNKLTATQDTSAVLSKNYGQKSYFINNILTAKSPASAAPSVVLPMERKSGKLDFDEQNYIPGAEHFFDEGIKALVNSSNNEAVFSDLSTFASQYDTVTTNLLSDFKMMRGLDFRVATAVNVGSVAPDSPTLISSNTLIDKLNNGIADLLDTHLNVAKPNFSSLFSLIMIRQATKSSYFFSALLTYFKMREIKMGIGIYNKTIYETDKNKSRNKAHYNAFSFDYKDDNQKRQETYKQGFGEERKDKHEENVSIMKYCFSFMFLNVMIDVLNMPNNGDQDKKALKNDFHIWKNHIPKVFKTLGGDIIDGEPNLDKMIAEEEKFYKKEFEGFEDAFNDGRGLLKAINQFVENFESENLSEAFMQSIETPVDSFLINNDVGIASSARRKMETNGGSDIWQMRDNGSTGLALTHAEKGMLNLNTNRSRTYLGLNSTIDTRKFALWSYILSVLSRAAVVRVEHREKQDRLKLIGYRKVTRTAIAALRGNDYNTSKHVHSTYYDIAGIRNSLKNEVNENTIDCLKHFLLLKGQSHGIKRKIQEMDRFVKGSAGGHDYRQALRYYEESGIGKKLLSFLSPSMVASNKYSELSLMTASTKMPSFPSCDVYSSQQLQNMIAYFNQPDKGFYASEKNPVLGGRKTVMHVGIPSGMLENLQFESIMTTGDSTYEGSNLVMLTIYRKDVLNSKSYVYPKTFIFDMSRFTVEGMQGVSASQLSGKTFLSAAELKANSTLHKIDGFGQLHRMPAGSAYDTTKTFYKNEPNYDEKFKNSIFNNHLDDNYFKMYFKLMTGLDFKEYVFQLTPGSAVMNGPDGSNADLLNKIRSSNLLLFPDAYEDPNSATELEKINRGISNTLFFNSERYMKACIYPNVFDRVFSVLINERDFIYSSGNPQKDKSVQNYGSSGAPKFNIDLGIEATQNLIIPNSIFSPTKNYYNLSRNKNCPQVYMYYAQVTLMKRIEKPDY